MEVVAEEQANLEFEQYAEAMDFVSEETMDAERRSDFNDQKYRIVKAIQNGSLIFNEEGEAVFTPRKKASKYKEPITFHERSGTDLSAMDSTKNLQNVQKMYRVLGSMCKVPPSVFYGLVGNDIKICEALFALLMV